MSLVSPLASTNDMKKRNNMTAATDAYVHCSTLPGTTALAIDAEGEATPQGRGVAAVPRRIDMYG